MGYTVNDIEKMIQEMTGQKRGPTYFGGVQYQNEVRKLIYSSWFSCLELVFDNLQYEWSLNPVWKKNGHWDILAVYDNRCNWQTNKVYAPERIAAVTTALELIETELGITEKSSFTLVGGNKYLHVQNNPSQATKTSKDYESIVVEYRLSNYWRYHPALVFLILNMLRYQTKNPAVAAKAFMKRKVMKEVKKHGIKAIFGRSFRSFLQEGKKYSRSQGAAYFTANELSKILERLNKQ